jgi:hypothetical protein
LPICNATLRAFFNMLKTYSYKPLPPLCTSTALRIPKHEKVILIASYMNAKDAPGLASNCILVSRSNVISRIIFRMLLLKAILSSIYRLWSSSIRIAFEQMVSAIKTLMMGLSGARNFSVRSHMNCLDR